MDVTKTCRDISELTEHAQTACKLFVDKCKAKGLNVLITETYRSQERQNYLYEQGRTRPGKKVTWTKQSRHTFRRAWDICKNVKGHEYDDANFFKECGKIAKELGIIWGGTWKDQDTPHFEIDANWVPPKQVDEDLKKAAHKLAMKYNVNECAWDDVSHMKMMYAQMLINKLGGIKHISEAVKSKGMQFDDAKWEHIISTGSYSSQNMRALIIKYASTL